MKQIASKTDFVDTLPAAEFNNHKNEIQNVLTQFGISFDALKEDQLGRAIAAYVAASAFYACTNVVNAYTLTPISARKAPEAYHDGMLVRFRPSFTSTGNATVNVNTIGVKKILEQDGSTQVAAGRLSVLADITLRYDPSADTASGAFIVVTPDVVTPTSVSGNSVKISKLVDGNAATGTTLIPDDDSITQNTEGDEYMTLAHTPLDAANLLRVDVVWFGASSATSRIFAPLFKDSVADSLANGGNRGEINNITVIAYTYFMVAGGTSPITFKVRAGAETAGTVTFNGMTGTRRFGGTMASSIIVTEYKA